MDAYPLLPQRVWNMRPWRSNPLMRASYRVESVLHCGAIVLIALAVPIAAALGTTNYTVHVHQSDLAGAAFHSVRATLDADVDPGDMVSGVMTVPSHWNYADKTHSGAAIVDANAKAGDHLSIWVDNNGNQTAHPPTHSEALPDAIALSFGVFGLFTAFILMLWHGLGWWLERRRRATWSREWAALEGEPKWNHP